MEGTCERVIIVGAGVAGLSAALALGRAGHDVVLVERDPLPPAADVEEAFEATRRGAPQVHQTHGFLARIRVALRERFPDVLDDLLAVGGMEMPFTADLGEPLPGDDDLKVLIVRRTTFEWVLRQAVVDTDKVEFVTGRRVIRLLTESANGDGASPPAICGVELDDGAVLHAGVTVAATGRRGPVPEWLAHVGVDVDETIRPSGLMYLSRWYRLPAGFDLEIDPKLGGDLGFVKYLAVPGDGNTLSITLAINPEDKELRKALSDGGAFERACRVLPGPRQFFEHADNSGATMEPVGGVRPMTGLMNRIRRFTDADRPIVTGFHAVGDAHTCTNPLYGRGCSLAVVQALAVADAIADYADDPWSRAMAYEAASAEQVEPWYHQSVQMDAAGADPSGLSGGLGTGNGGGEALAAVFAAAATDPVLGRGFARFWNLLSTPAELMGDAQLMGRMAEVMANPRDYPVPPREGPTRAELLDLLATEGATL